MSNQFITFEGVDGAGKSSHLDWLCEHLRAQGNAVTVTREPGGTALGEQLRQLLLNQEMHQKTEALLMFAARQEHIEKVIRPALEEGQWVICDRFTDASFAYQSGGRGLAWSALQQLERWVHDDLQPDLTLFFDLPVEAARQRLNANSSLDRFEQQQSDFFERVRQAYFRRIEQCPERYRVIDAAQSLSQVRQQVKALFS